MNQKPIALSMLTAMIAFLACNIFPVQPNTTLPPMSADDLLLDVDAFPEGWNSSPCDTNLCKQDSSGITAAERDFYLPNIPGHVYQEVFHFPDDGQAKDKFAVYMSGNFNEADVRQPFVPFTPPPEITFKSKIADEYYLACGIDVIPQCKLLSRYENYFVYFYFDLSTGEERGGLTYSQIEKVLEALEVHASNKLIIVAEGVK